MSPATQITSAQQVARPIDVYLPSASEVLQVTAVETRKINACLTSKSVPATYSPAQDATQLAPFVAGLIADNIVRSDLWGYFNTDKGLVSKDGYKRDPGSPQILIASVPPSAGDAFSACQAAADQGLPGGGGGAAFLGTVSLLPNRGPSVPSSDSRWVQAEDAWSKCMKDAGFDYKTPLAAIGDSRWQQSQSASSLEIATASADIACKLQTNLVGIGLAIQTAYDQQYIDANRQALESFKSQLAAYLKS